MVTLPNGSNLFTAGTGTLNLRSLPKNATKAYILPGLRQNSLVSIGTLCDSGCTATFTHQSITVKDEQGREALKGHRDPVTRLWHIPISDEDITTKEGNVIDTKLNKACLAIHKHPIQKLVKYLHATLFSPAIFTLLKAIKMGYLDTFPALTTQNVKKYLAVPDSKVLGHMDQSRCNQKSTKCTKSQEFTEQGSAINHTFIATEPIDKI